MSSVHLDLRAIAQSNERMIQLFRWLDGLDVSRNTTRGMDIRDQNGTIAVEQFVESGIADGAGICFWLETRFAEADCVVEASILHQIPTGQETFRGTSVTVGPGVDYPAALKAMTGALWRWREDGVARAAKGSNGG